MDAERKEQKEYEEQITEGQEVSDLVKSKEWKLVKGTFIKKIVELNDLTTVNFDTENLSVEILARQSAVQVLMDIIADIEGRARQHITNSQALRDTQEAEIIKIFDDE